MLNDSAHQNIPKQSKFGVLTVTSKISKTM